MGSPSPLKSILSGSPDKKKSPKVIDLGKTKIVIRKPGATDKK